MRSLIALSCVFLLASTAAARSLAESGAKSKAAASVAAALNSTSQLSTLEAAVTAAGIDIPADSVWTILAPTNDAFATALKCLNTTAEKLLANKELLTRVLQYHVIPGGAVLSSQLKDKNNFDTALEGADPLTARVKSKDGKTYVKFVGASNYAKVVTPDVKAGRSVVHIVKNVLLPAGVGPCQGKKMGYMMNEGAKGKKMGNKMYDGAKGKKMGDKAAMGEKGNKP